MGDRGHNRHGRKREGLQCPFRGELRSRLIQCGWAEVYFRTKWRLHPSSRLATIDMNRKLGSCALSRGELRPHLKQRRLGRGLPRYEVAS